MRGKNGKRLLLLFSNVLLILSALAPISSKVEAATIMPPSGNTTLFSNDFESVTDTGPVYPGSTATVGGFTPLFQYAPASGDTTDSISLQNASDFNGTSTNNGSKVLVLTDTNDAASISGDGTTVSFSPGTTSDQIGVTKVFSNSGITSGSLGIEFDYATTNISSGTYLFKLLGGTSYSQSPVLIYLGMKNGYLSWYDSSNNYHYITSSSLSKNAWYHIKLSVNLDNFTYNLTVTPTGSANSLGSVNQLPFMQNAVSTGNNASWSSKNSITSVSAQMIGFNSAGSYSGQIALDNVQVYQPTTIPDTPTGVSDFVGDGQVWLWWPSVNNATSYDILRATDASGPFTSLTNGAGMITPPTQSNPYEDLGLTDGTTYYYVVRATDSYGSSDSQPLAAAPSNSVPAPQPPTGLSATVRDSAVTVSWNIVSNATGYTLERSISPDMSSPVVLNSALPYNQTSYYDANLTDGTTYYYALSSQGAGGTSVLSTPFAVAPSTPLAYPAELTASPGNARVDLAWDNIAAAVSYNVKRSTTSGGPYTLIASNLTSTNYTDSSVSNASMYYYVVSAVSPTMESLISPQVQAIPYSSANNAPTASTGVSIVAGDSQLNLSWNAVSGATSYNVKRATAYSGPYTLLNNVTGTSYQDTAVTNGTTYYYQISAINANSEGAASRTVIGTAAHVIVVAQDGTGDYTSVQAAIDSIPANNTTRTVIYIKDGTYYEKISIPNNKPYISLVGQSQNGTILTYDDYSCKASPSGSPSSTSFPCTNAGVPIGGTIMGTGNSYSVSIAAGNTTVENLTIQNSAFPRSVVAPAVALYAAADKLIFNNVKILGFQDTLYANSGRQYYKNSWIEGDVDFIFGNATAVFDNSQVKFVGNAGGSVTAASTDQNSAYGYVFLNDRLTRGTSSLKNSVTVNQWNPAWDIDNNMNATNNTVNLGRPWRPYANVKFINTWMDAQIKAVGWDNWGSSANQLTARYGEYNSSGPGANPSARYNWTSQLSSSEADVYSVQNVLKGSDGWDPTLFGVIPEKPSAPQAPNGVQAIGGNASVNLSWNPISGAQSYNIYRSTSTGGPYTKIANVAESSFTDVNVANDSTYFYTVTSVNAAGEGSLSGEISVVPGQPSITPTTATFDRNPVKQADVAVSVFTNGDTLASITNGSYTLVPSSDYTVSGNVYTISESYLAQLPNGTANMVFQFSSGINLPLSISITNTMPAVSPSLLTTQTITSIEPVNLTTKAGVAPFMPSLVMAGYSDGSTLALGVTWNNIDPAQYAAPGTFSIQGNVSGSAIPAVATITVVPSSSTAGVTTNGPQDQDLQSYLTNLPFQMPSITVPQFPNHDFNIQDYGAVADGTTDNRKAINQAISAASAAGGGRVVVPGGVWLTGPIQLQSNVNLYLAAGAQIQFSPNYNEYLQGSSYQAPIYGTGLTNVAITGNGVIDGNGQYWRPIKESKLTTTQWNYLLSLGGVTDGGQWYASQLMVNASRPVLVDLRNSSNLLIDGPTVQNSPSFTLSLHYDQNVVIRNTTVNNAWWAQNGDGIDLTSCQNAVLYHNTVNAGDDGLAVKANGTPSAYYTSNNIVMANNIVFHGHGGFSAGSNISGGLSNIMIRDSEYIDTDAGIKFKSDVGSGGPVQNVYFDGINMFNIATDAIHFDSFYNGDNAASESAQIGDSKVPEYKNIHISNVTVSGAKQGLYIWALPHVPLHDVDLSNVRINSAQGASTINAYNVTLNNVQITPASGATFTLNNSSNFGFNSVLVPAGANPFLHLQGSSSGIQLNNTDYSTTQVPFQFDSGIRPTVITVTGPGSLSTTAALSPSQPDGLNGWYVHPVTVTLTATDKFAAVANTSYSLDGGATWNTYTGPFTVSQDGTSTITFFSTEKTGIVEQSKTVSVKMDQTPPIITGAATTQPNSNGWYNSDVTVHFNSSDAMSGLASTTPDQIMSTEGANQSVTGTAVDDAGNSATFTVSSINIDKTAPTTAAVLDPVSPNVKGWYKEPVTVSLNAKDKLSGVASTVYSTDGGQSWLPYTGVLNFAQDGKYTVQFYSVDNAGNQEAVNTINFQIDQTPPTLTITLDKTQLWPPNNQLVPIQVTIDAGDLLSGITSVALTSITSNESDSGLGDIQGADYNTDDTQFSLRATRAGSGTDRVYSITYTATDNAGNATTKTVTVTVPHDMGTK